MWKRLRFSQRMFNIPSEGEGLEMMKKVGLVLIGTLFVVGLRSNALYLQSVSDRTG